MDINYKLFNEKGKKEPQYEINIKTPTTNYIKNEFLNFNNKK